MLRRHLLLLPTALLPLPALADTSQQAAEFIRQAGGRLTATIGGAGTLAEKRRALAPFMAEVVDVDGVARFCLGRFWRSASPAQQAEYLQLFRVVLVNSVAGRLGDYQGQTARINVGKPEVRPEGVVVPTTVERPNNKPVNVSWLVTQEGGTPRIADVVAEGMSLRLAQRSDYTSFLSRNNGDVEALLTALRAQAADGAPLR